MPNVDLSQAELEFLKALVDEEVACWEHAMESEDDRRTAVRALTLANKLEGKSPETAELEARRQVGAWWDELTAPGGA